MGRLVSHVFFVPKRLLSYTTVNVTPPWGKLRLLDNQEGANTDRHNVFGKALGEMFPTTTLLAPKPGFQQWRYQA